MATMSIISDEGTLESASAVLEVSATNEELTYILSRSRSRKVDRM